MTSPVGHSLGGYIVAGRHPSNPVFSKLLAGLMFLVFAANAPDLDFLVGAWMGDFNGYHHRASHSIAAGLIFAGVVYLIGRWLKFPAAYLALSGGLAYLSHIGLDLITNDTHAPFGLQLYWPFSEQFIIAPQYLFINIEHGRMDDTWRSALPAIFSKHNLVAMGIELAILGPLALIVFWRRLSKQKSL